MRWPVRPAALRAPSDDAALPRRATKAGAQNMLFAALRSITFHWHPHRM
jgi:hypothetical protein